MKYLLVTAVVLVAFWIWRNNRRADQAAPPPPRSRAVGQPAPMVACGHCGMHLPADEAVQGRHGSYCCQEHRRQAEGAAG